MMKRHNSIHKVLLAMILLIAGTVASHAAVYTWSKYNLTFETPEGGFVTYSSNTRFEIQWDDMVVTIQLYSKDKSDDESIKNNLTRKAMSYNMYDTSIDKMKVKGFKAPYLEGTMPDGSRAIIADLISKKQDLIVEVTVNYLFGNREMVDDLIKSFAEGKPQEVKSQDKKHKQKVQSKEDADKQDKETEKQSKHINKRTYDA